MITRVEFNKSVLINGDRFPRLSSESIDMLKRVSYSTGARGPGIEVDVDENQIVFIPMSNVVSVHEEF